MRSRQASCAGLIAAALVFAGCGSLGASYRGPRNVPARLISKAQIMHYPAGSPERTLLQFLRDLRLDRLHVAGRVFLPSVRREDGAGLYFILRFAERYLRADSTLRILDVVHHPDRATVFTDGSTQTRFPNGRRARPIPLLRAYTFVRRKGAWRLPDDSWIRYASAVVLRRSVLAPATPTPRVVTRRAVDRYPVGSPARAALELVRLLQFGDVTGIRAFLTPHWRASVAEVRTLIGQEQPSSWRFGVPTVLGVTSSANRARVRGRLGEVPATFAFVRVHGEWKLDRIRLSPTLVLPASPLLARSVPAG